MVIITNILEIEQHLDGITSVIFDLDDTLYSEKQYVRSGYKAVAKRMWCTQAFQRNLIVTYIPDELYCYVMREGSIIHSKFNRGKLDSFTVSEERIKVLQRCGYMDLLSYEYRRFFKIVLALYQEASLAGDMEAQRVIKEKFEKYKNEINESKALSGKFYVIFKCMCINYSWINLYSFYKRSKKSK